jgi:hypothetical protein
MDNKTQKLLIAGASIPLAEAGFAMMHAGPIGVFCGLAAGAVACWVADEMSGGKDTSLSTASDNVDELDMQDTTTRTKAPDPSKLLYRIFNGKSVRGDTDAGRSEPTSRRDRQPQKEVEQERRSRSVDPYALRLAPDYVPHINDVLGRCILGVGQRGTGKSNLAARFIEQVGHYPIPMFIGDYKQDYITLPEVLPRCVIAGSPDWEGQQECQVYWQVTQENAYQAGAYLMHKGIQLVFECLTYQNLNEAAEIMTLIIQGMFDWALRQPSGQRVPTLVVLDEAQQFLPQSHGDSAIDSEVSGQLLSAFEKLNSVGRSLGFTPAFFTQRIAQIRKEVIGGSELFFLMRQTLPQDLKVYEDLIGKDAQGKLLLDRRIVKGLGQGDGIVYEGGEFFVTHFDQRESRHLSTTPELEDALAYYGERHPTMDLRTMEPLAMKYNMPTLPSREPSPSSTDPIQAAINKLVAQLEAGEIDQDTFLNKYAAIPSYPTNSQPVAQTPHTNRRVSKQEQEEQLLLDRAIEAFLNGANTLDKLALALGITQHRARQLKPRIEEKLRQEEYQATE